MNLDSKILRITCLAAATFTMAAPAHAASSGWVNANDLQRFSRNTLRSDNIPTAIACKNDDVVAGMDRRNTLVKVEYKSNPTHTPWRWAWGGNVGKIGIDLTKKGYHLVSEDSFRRKSGLLIRCAIWSKS